MRTAIRLSFLALLAITMLWTTPSQSEAMPISCGADGICNASCIFDPDCGPTMCDPNRQCGSDDDCGEFGACAVFRLCICFG